MRIFKTKQFARLADKNDIDDEIVRDAASDIEDGKFEADLGGGVIKKRIAREGEGKSGGYRFLVCFRKGERMFFAYLYPKNVRQNINGKELAALRKLADQLFGLSDAQLVKYINAGFAVELKEENNEDV